MSKLTKTLVRAATLRELRRVEPNIKAHGYVADVVVSVDGQRRLVACMAPVRSGYMDAWDYFDDRAPGFSDKAGVYPGGPEWCNEQRSLGKSGVLRIVRAEIKRREKARQC